MLKGLIALSAMKKTSNNPGSLDTKEWSKGLCMSKAEYHNI